MADATCRLKGRGGAHIWHIFSLQWHHLQDPALHLLLIYFILHCAYYISHFEIHPIQPLNPIILLWLGPFQTLTDRGSYSCFLVLDFLFIVSRRKSGISSMVVELTYSSFIITHEAALEPKVPKFWNLGNQCQHLHVMVLLHAFSAGLYCYHFFFPLYHNGPQDISQLPPPPPTTPTSPFFNCQQDSYFFSPLPRLTQDAQVPLHNLPATSICWLNYPRAHQSLFCHLFSIPCIHCLKCVLPVSKPGSSLICPTVNTRWKPSPHTTLEAFTSGDPGSHSAWVTQPEWGDLGTIPSQLLVLFTLFHPA